ncbi:MAG: tetratricopeptide repeat protein [Bacteroidales bacterium]
MRSIIYTGTFLILLILGLQPCGAKRKQAVIDKSSKVQYLLLEAARLENTDSLSAAFDVLRSGAAMDTSNADIKYQLALYYYRLQQPQTAYSYMLSAAEGSPDNYWYNVSAANLAMRIGDKERAVNLYRGLLDKNQGDEELLSMLAEAYLNADKYEEALACYDRLESMTGNIEYIVTTKANIFDRLKQKDKMLAELKRLSDAYPESIEYLLTLASGYINADSLDRGMEIIHRAETIEHGNCFINISKAEYYAKKGEADSLRTAIYDALSCTDLALDVKQDILKNYLYGLLQKDKDVKSFGKADTLFSSLIDSYPRESGLRNFYADILLMQNKYGKAEEQLRVSLDLEPANIDVWKKFIGALYNKGDYAEMDVMIDKALPFSKGDSTFIVAAGGYYFFAKQERKAIEMLKRGIEEFRNSPQMLSDIYAQLGDIYYQSEKQDSSFISYDKAISYNPKNLGALNNYSYYITISGGDLSKAEKLSAVTVSEEPNNPTYLDTYGWVFFKKGNYTLAELYIKRAMQNGGEGVPDILEHYGDILSREGRAEEAVEYWQKALDAGSTSGTLEMKIKNRAYTD